MSRTKKDACRYDVSWMKQDAYGYDVSRMKKVMVHTGTVRTNDTNIQT